MSRLAIFLALFIGTQAHAQSKDTLLIAGRIDERSVNVAQNIADLVSGGAKSIAMVIDSGGGRVDVAAAIVNTMMAAKTQGVTFKCLVLSEAASAAFFIFSACDERYALPLAKLMWHQTWQTHNHITAETARRIAFERQLDDEMFASVCIPALGVTAEFYRHHLLWETKWYAVTLHSRAPGFLNIVTDANMDLGGSSGK